uniref:NAD(P)H-hydrate dehydratase n=1 Tax=uncultured Micrococcus sp. TaxID=114051 RepID=UPI0026326AFB|nr:NAD(P)H-hydrate dehydratase [uncultured Micrococcus sp.]
MTAQDLSRLAVPGSTVRAAEEPLLAAGRGPELMRSAAWALAEHAATLLRARGPVAGATVAALVGPGNNGGDALFALAFLRRRGVAAVAVPVRRDDDGAPRWHAEGWAALRAAGGRCADAVPSEAALVVDGVLGTGFAGEFELPAAARALPADALVLACDVPSGVDADTGEVRGEALRADATVTFGALKTGLVLGEGAALAGVVHVADIGLAPHLPTSPAARLCVMDEAAARAAHPAPAVDAHKYTRGVVAVVAGSERYPGAAVLASVGALEAGAGMVHHAGPKATRDLVLAAHPEALVSAEGPEPSRADAWVAGPGLDTEHDARRRWAGVLEALAERPEAALVADASALDLVTAAELRTLRAAGTPVVLTPHAGEWSRLRDRVPAEGADASDPLEALRAWSAEHGATVLLKGPRTLVVAPDGEAWVVTGGGPELAMGGTGDVLSGAIGAVLAVDVARRARVRRSEEEPGPVPAARLAAAAAWLHARAGTDQARSGRVTTRTLPAALGARVARLWWPGEAEPETGR